MRVTGEATRVLVVDADASIRRSLARALMAEGHEVLTAEAANASVPLVVSAPVDVVILEATADVARDVGRLARARADMAFVLLAPVSTFDAALAVARDGPHDLLPKPLHALELVTLAVLRAKRRAGLARDLADAGGSAAGDEASSRTGAATPVASSRAMAAVVRAAEASASAPTPVLVLGEPGTGKARLARHQHASGVRRARPFVAVGLSALAPESLEPALFGARGLLAEAGGGTLLLAGVEALPLVAQARLLAVLERGTDARVVATSTPELRARVEQGAFRRELFYRLAVTLLEVPPLRRRREDLPVLAHELVAEAAARQAREVRRVSKEAVRELLRRPFPGNVRELSGLLDRAVAAARGESIFPADLPRDVDTPDVEVVAPRGAITLPGGIEDLPFADAKERVVASFEAQYVGSLLARTSGNVSEAARRAGLDRANFRRLVRRAR